MRNVLAMSCARGCVFVAMGLLMGVANGQGGFVAGPAQAASAAVRGQNQVSPPVERNISEWLVRMHEASRNRTYMGTFVVSSSAGGMSSARIWHACDGDRQVERVESLTGAPRTTFRRNEEVVTFLPESRVVLREKREFMALFPNVLTTKETSIPEFYSARQVGSERVAGFEADVVQLAPRDNLRFGYRIWSEKKTGLVVKLQTLGNDGQVLEQAAFSELQLDAPVRMDKLSQMMSNTDGWRVEKTDLVKTTAETEGWTLKTPVPGFKAMSCLKRPITAVIGPTVNSGEGAMQWIFSDGLASVSLFVEVYDPQRHTQEVLRAMGATQTLTRKLTDKTSDKVGGQWWLTAVGEVPAATLKSFAQSLERRK
jgi:sigma-E factor negative regulatory protein RseB